ncbi:MAG: hypothetical protein KBC15_00565 [Candidatus Levybacteria bacterium]|nr:hypothetical protein [Candidatus Levybacteria bacterium]
MNNKPQLYEEHPHNIQAKNGDEFVSTLYLLKDSFGKFPKSNYLASFLSSILALASRSFPHWTEKEYLDFANETLLTTKAFSIISDASNKHVGFNFYTLGDIRGDQFMYTNYTAIDPDYRRIGLMEKSRSADIVVVDLAILAGCSSVGAVHLGMHRLSDETGRVMYPLDVEVPDVIGKLGREIYADVNGADTWSSVNPQTLVRQSASPYAKGEPEYPLFEKLKLGRNEAVIYLSLTKKFNDELLARKID